MLRELFNRFKCPDAQLNFGREIIVRWSRKYIRALPDQNVAVLDIGCHRGTDLWNVQRAAGDRALALFGIELYEPVAAEARRRGITVFSIDIERQAIPVADESFDIVIANQILEHTKEIFWIFSEVSRVIKKGGWLIVGVPNLAALHNRILLLVGEQPTTIEPLGPHVRGFTAPAFKRFVETDGYFRLRETRGANFYPFSGRLGAYASKMLPTLAVALFFLVERENKPGLFIHVLDTRFFQTAYFRGNQT